MPRPLSALAAAGVAALALVALTATATGAPRAVADCTVLAAKSGILASNLPMRIKHDAAERMGSGIDRLICRDLTGDGRKDMVASVFSKARGIEAWVFFRAMPSEWRLSFRRIDLLAARIGVVRNGVNEVDPVFRQGDQRPCCPSGGQKHYRFVWLRGKMVKIRAWHSERG
jgi:hypothetical protein